MWWEFGWLVEDWHNFTELWRIDKMKKFSVRADMSETPEDTFPPVSDWTACGQFFSVPGRETGSTNIIYVRVETKDVLLTSNGHEFRNIFFFFAIEFKVVKKFYLKTIASFTSCPVLAQLATVGNKRGYLCSTNGQRFALKKKRERNYRVLIFPRFEQSAKKKQWK